MTCIQEIVLFRLPYNACNEMYRKHEPFIVQEL